MDSIAQILAFIQNIPALHVGLVVLGALVVLGGVVVGLTPSQSDDQAYDKIMNIPVLGQILKAVAAFSPFQKK